MPPSKTHVDKKNVLEESELLEKHFKYHRKFRSKEYCPPWVLGQELGWYIRSPITTSLTAIKDVQIAEDIDPAESGHVLNVTEFWRRGKGYIATEKNSWIRSFVYRNHDGAWESMFLPNGEGTIEWHLGWGMEIPSEYFMLVHALDDTCGLEIPTGVLTAKQANRTWDGGGMSIAIRPTSPVEVRRGQPIARMTLLHRDSLQAQLDYDLA